MIVSPSRAHALVDAVVPSVSVLYEVLSLPTLRYKLVLADWTVVLLAAFLLPQITPGLLFLSEATHCYR